MFTINQPNGLHPSLVHANNGRAGCRGFSSGIENLEVGKPLDFVFLSMSFSVRCVIYSRVKSTLLYNMSKKCHFKIYFSCILYKRAENSEPDILRLHTQIVYNIQPRMYCSPFILWTLGTSRSKTKAISSLYHTIEGRHSQGEHHKYVTL